jgi:hypothetical protein
MGNEPGTAAATTRTTKPAAEKPAKAGAKKPAATTTPDKATLQLAKRVMTMRDREQMSWLKIGAACNLAPDAASPKAGASRARTLYRMVKGEDAYTGPIAQK